MNKSAQWIIGGILGIAGLASGVNFLLNSAPNLAFVVQNFNSPAFSTGSQQQFKVCKNYQCTWSLTNDGKTCDESAIGDACAPTGSGSNGNANNANNNNWNAANSSTGSNGTGNNGTGSNGSGNTNTGSSQSGGNFVTNVNTVGLTGSIKRYKVCTNYQCAWSLTNDGKVCDQSPLGAQCKPPVAPSNNPLTNVSGSNNSGTNNNSGTSLFHT